LFRSCPECFCRLVFVLPAVETERGLEQRHLGEPFLPAGFLSIDLPGVLLRVRDSTCVRESHSLDVVERDRQKRCDAHHLVKRRSLDATELPAFDRSGADANDLAEACPRVARRLAPLLEKPG